MSAFDERRVQDLEKLRELERVSRNRIRILNVSGTPASKIEIEIQLKTAASTSYPKSVQPVTQIVVSLPARYPFVEPTVDVKTPILHPNVYASGRICLGVKWIPSLGLNLLVRRVVQIITYDPDVLNLQSPANGAAVSWYKQAIRSSPHAFPTDALDLAAKETAKMMEWKNAGSAPDAKVIVVCTKCNSRLSVPTGRKGTIKCPKCGNSFAADT